MPWAGLAASGPAPLQPYKTYKTQGSHSSNLYSISIPQDMQNAGQSFIVCVLQILQNAGQSGIGFVLHICLHT